MLRTSNNLSYAQRKFHFHFGIRNNVIQLQSLVRESLIHGSDHSLDPLVQSLADQPYRLFLCDEKSVTIVNESVDDLDHVQASQLVPNSTSDNDLFLHQLFHVPSNESPFNIGSYMLERLFDEESHGPFADGYHLEILFNGTIPLLGAEFHDSHHIDLFINYLRRNSPFPMI